MTPCPREWWPPGGTAPGEPPAWRCHRERGVMVLLGLVQGGPLLCPSPPRSISPPGCHGGGQTVTRPGPGLQGQLFWDQGKRQWGLSRSRAGGKKWPQLTAVECGRQWALGLGAGGRGMRGFGKCRRAPSWGSPKSQRPKCKAVPVADTFQEFSG